VSSVLERLGSAQPRETVAKNRLLIVGMIAFAVVLGGWLIYAFSQPESSTLWPVDLAVYRDGGLIVRQLSPYNAKLGAQPFPLYDWTGAGNLNFTYTPFAALFFAGVSFIPWSVLPRVVQVANLIFLVIAAWCTMGALGYRDRRVRLGGTLLGVAAGLLTEPVFRTLYLGQINLLLMAAIIWDLRQPDSRRLKGIATGLAAGIKLTPLVFIPYLLLTRKFRAAAVATGSFVFTIALGFIILPRDSKDWWFNGLFIQDGRTGFVGWTGNQSLRAVATRLAGSIDGGTVPWVVLALLATVVGLLAAAQLDRAGHTMLGLLTAALVGLLDSPISWDHHWVWVMPGMMAAGHYAAKAWQARRRAVAYWCSGLIVALLLIFAPWPGNLWGVHNTGPGNFTQGLIWDGPYTPVTKYIEYGDLPWFKEYHWTWLQNLAGNAYVLVGIALLVLLAIVAFRSRSGQDVPLSSGDSGSAAAAPSAAAAASTATASADATVESSDATVEPSNAARPTSADEVVRPA
jgi:alpha-1,2-mannosyltransferase